MKKILLIGIMLFATSLFAQNSLEWSVRYYGDGNATSSALQIADADSISGEYSIPNSPITIAVDSNWTASGIGFLVYNYLEETWELLCDEDGDILEYTIAVGAPIAIPPIRGAALKTVKFAKITSGSYVAQSGAASSLQIGHAKFN